MPKLILVDGSSYLYRAFHALPELKNREGLPTGAIYGVISMLRRLVADTSDAHRAIVFDAKGRTFREDWFPDYKAHRPPMPEDLAVQIEPLHECIRALGWPLVMVEGVEADDVIGTLARQASASGMDCVISTGDKDLAQLVGPHVRLINTMTNETLDEAGVMAKFSVEPSRITDYLALVGDSVDNVPGVPKVGPKTAVKWLAQYGTLDAIVERAGEIGGAVGENLRRHLDFLPLARRLVTVVCDLDLPVRPEDLKPSPPDNEKLAELFARLGFKSWLKEMKEIEEIGDYGSQNRGLSPISAISAISAIPDVDAPLAEVLRRMERAGMLIDVFALAAQSVELGQKMAALEAEAHALAGQPFNLNSPKQLAEILFEKQGLPVIKRTPTKAPSTDEEVLEQLALDYPLPRKILDWRSAAKLKNTYTDKLPRMVDPATGRVHTTFSQDVAVTGRLTSSNPNLQNIPVRTAEGRRIRSAFIAPPGHVLVSADYSQIELRIMAHFSGDARLLEAFARGEDVHRSTAAEIFGIAPGEVGPDQRRAAKVINFGLIYGMSVFGLARELGLDRGAAQATMDRYFARYPGVARFMEEARRMAHEKGYVETLFGRRLPVPDINSGSAGRRQAAERAAINAPMQGTAADLIKLAMLAVQRWLDDNNMSSKLILQVHDELVLEVPDAELAAVREALPGLMAGVAKLKVPLVVDVGVGANWDQAH
ncbi:MAG: DNA polymerase I [Candidatus Nitricoxidivorans perseverans]|uniref:DNA polymerase I n=1 Tax=Candidatus Nitricoxidivorans perseverans TaxID=2975601 RepID=A0AA49FK64_9PROT|nr:MAG: DNA polymerase I [Candidatus Nitricoxidivorans perseverans]